MNLMKKVLLSTSLLSIALVFNAKSFASDVTIHNSNFDALTLTDGSSSSIIHNWEVTSGLVGVHNPTSDLFDGEGGAGDHNNTLYMINDSSVSQTLTFKGLEFTTYTMSFDVGQRFDVAGNNYSIKVTTSDQTLLWATNPELPSAPGSFKHVSVQFSTEALPDDYLTVEIETFGTGHLHFDNLNMSFEVDTETNTNYYRTVGHYIITTNTRTREEQCLKQTALKDANGDDYLTDSCQCRNSKSVIVGSNALVDTIHKSNRICVKEANHQ